MTDVYLKYPSLNPAKYPTFADFSAQAVWDELLATHTISGSAGEKLQKLPALSQYLGLK